MVWLAFLSMFDISDRYIEGEWVRRCMANLFVMDLDEGVVG